MPPTKRQIPRNRNQQPPRSTAQQQASDALLAMGENGAPGTPDHLMPSPQASGVVGTVEEKDQPEVDDLTDAEKAEHGYPNPDETDEQSMSSTRKSGSVVNQTATKVETGHIALDHKLDEISAATETAKLITEDEPSDYAKLPGAPKGAVLVLGPEDPLKVSGEQQGGVIVLDKAVWRAHRPFRSQRWAFRLEYPLGHHLPMSVVQQVPVPVDAGDEPPHNIEDTGAATEVKQNN
jgi:hypothetical protein